MGKGGAMGVAKIKLGASLPALGMTTRSMFGSQCLSCRLTAPQFGFGTAHRSAVEKVYLTPEHARTNYGKNSPGPVYDVKSSMGKQENSRNLSAPFFTFGTAERMTLQRASKSPGPGHYAQPTSVGKQVDSTRGSSSTFGFGSSTREHMERCFMSRDHEKSRLGINSPGPCSYNVNSAIGRQANSMNFTNPQWAFGSEGRFRYDFEKRAKQTPGAGHYSVVASVGPQVFSKRRSMPIFGFGTCRRDQRAKVRAPLRYRRNEWGPEGQASPLSAMRRWVGEVPSGRRYCVGSGRLKEKGAWTCA